ncbi:MAG: hypothetical protein ABEJ05_05790 [Haloglomus sp.]
MDEFLVDAGAAPSGQFPTAAIAENARLVPGELTGRLFALV